MKAKKFSRKLFALFLALVMVLTCFSGALSAFAATSSETKYHDGDLTYNSMTWPNLDDEQTCTAILDYADQMLGELNFTFTYTVDIVVSKITINIDATSVDALMQTIEGFQGLLDSYGGLIGGDVKNINLNATKGMRRNNTSSTDMVRGIVRLLFQNSNDANLYGNANKNILKQFLTGNLNLGLVGNFLNLYDTLGNLFTPTMATNYSNWQSNLVYNLVQNLILEYSGWFTSEEKANIRTNSTPLDTVLFDKLSTELLAKINVCVTYADGTNSVQRYAEYLENGSAPYIDTTNLQYTVEGDGSNQKTGNVYLFRYKGETINLEESDNLFDFAYKAFEMAWNTVLKDTLGQLNSNVDGFDYNYYRWYVGAKTYNHTWNYSNVKSNYSEDAVKAWAQYECTQAAANAEKAGESVDPNYADADTFLKYVKERLTFDREAVSDPLYTWRDIDSTTLFNKLRYSPLADMYFNMATGPLNFSFAETGTPKINAFMANDYKNYSSLVAGLNDFLVAAVADFMPQGANTGTYDALEKVNSSDPKTIATTLVKNACAVIQYVADSTDKNILNAFYKNNPETALDESNLESALLPFTISVIKATGLVNSIHDSEWDACKDLEGVAAVALKEYLSYILPDKDYSSLMTKSGEYYNVTLDTTVLPMARDALGYILSSIVPLYDKNGNPWDPYTADVESDVTIYDLLNSVVVFYAGTTEFKDGAEGYGVANLFGICDKDGNCLIKLENDLWTNLDIIINHLVPVMGTLQYGTTDKYAQASSKELIYDDVISGFLEISDTSAHNSGLAGISNFCYRLLSFISAPPIKDTACIQTVYNLLADLVNAVLGARYNGQTYETVVPAKATDNHPFDNLLQVGVIAGTSDNNSIGVFGSIIYNLYQFTGGKGGECGYPDTVLTSLAFAVRAVNSFLSLVPTLEDHTLQLATASVKDAAVNSVNPGNTMQTQIMVNNNCYGLNRAYQELDGTNTQMTRYRVKINSIETDNSAFKVTSNVAGTIIMPESSTTFNVTYTAPSENTIVRYTVNYDIIDGDDNSVYPNLTCYAYQYTTTDKNWEDSVYTQTNDNPAGKVMDGSLLSVTAGSTLTTPDGLNQSKVTGAFASRGYLNVNYPAAIVVAQSNLESLNQYLARINNVSLMFGERSMDGIYCYVNDTVWDDLTQSNVALNQNNAIPCFDKETGDVLNYRLVDYSTDGGRSWVRGVSQDDSTLLDLINSGEDVEIRTNHAYTFEELKSNGNIAAYHQDENGVFQYLYLKSGSVAYSTLLGKISCATPIDGIYLATSKITVSSNSQVYFQFLAYDGTTKITGQTATLNLCFYNSDTSATGEVQLYICDDSNSATLSSRYNEVQNYLTNYRPSDFIDYSEDTQTSEVYNTTIEALTAGLNALATPISTQSALELSDVVETVAATSETQSFYGDEAYKPVSNSAELPTSLLVNATSKEINGVTYFFNDAECKFPFYTDKALQDGDVSGQTSQQIGDEFYTVGKDAVGTNVVKVDGKWYVMNDQAYTYKWDLNTYDTPYFVKDTVKEGYYDQVNFVYRDKDGNKTSSSSLTSPWVVKLAEGETVAKENDGEDYRGVYTKAIDYLTYALENCQNNVSTEVAQNIYDKVSTVRDNLNSVNFDVATYERMASLGKQAEDMYEACIYKTSDETREVLATCAWNQIDSTIANLVSQDTNPDASADDYTYYFTTTSSSLQIQEAIRVFELFMSKTIERGYQGDKLEAEIVCAGGSDYTTMTTSWTPVEGEPEAKNATVKTTADSVPYGAVSEDGTIVNEGEIKYSDSSWQNYINALATAVDLATLGNGDYAHKTPAFYDAADKDNYGAQISKVYDAKSKLVMAENGLEEATASTGYTVTGTVIALADASGNLASDAFTVRECNVIINGETVATTDDNGVFTINNLATGKYTATLSYAYGYDRDITIEVKDGDVELGKYGMVVCNFTKDATVNAADFGVMKTANGTINTNEYYNKYCDFNHDGTVNASDASICKQFNGLTLSDSIYGNN